MGAKEGGRWAWRGYKRRRAPDPDTPLRERSRGQQTDGQTRPSAGTIRLADQAGAERCCGCGVCAAGAAAPRRFTTSGLGCVRVRLALPQASTADLLLSGPSRELGFRKLFWLQGAWRCPRLGDTPRGHTGSLRVSGRGGRQRRGCALLSLISFAPRSCGPEGMGVTRTPFSKKVLLGLIASCGYRVGNASGVDGRRGRVGI